MKFRSLVLFVKSLFLFSRCYDDTQLKRDIAYLQHRVSAIESWCATANGQICALQSLVQALDNKDYITGVTPLAYGSGYTISFTKSKAITIKNGETGAIEAKGNKGEDAIVPIIDVVLDSYGKYYWIVKIGDGDSTWIVYQDSMAPVISIARYLDGNYYWQVNGEWMKINGNLVMATGSKGYCGAGALKRDAVFAPNGIENSNSDYVVFTLTNGNKIQLPKYNTLKIGNDAANEAITITSETLTIPIKMPSGFKESDYSSIIVQIIASNAAASIIKTKTAVDAIWKVTINEPTFISGECQDDATVIIKPIMGMLTVGDNSMLEVTIVGAEGINTTASRVITVGAIATAEASTHTVSLITKGSLTEKLINEALNGGNNLIINGLLSGKCANVYEGTIDGDWLTLRHVIQSRENIINLIMNNIVDVIPWGLYQCN